MGNKIIKLKKNSGEEFPTKDTTESPRRKIALFSLLYFVQGIPYGLQVRFLPIYLRAQGSSLTHLGLFKLLLIPWLVKPVWVPLVDRFGRNDKWLVWSLGGMAVTYVALATISCQNEALLCLCIFFINLLASIQDICVDSLAISTLKNSELASGNTAQVVGYKIGSIFGGAITWLNELIHWSWIFYGLSTMYAALTLSLLINNQRVESEDNLLEKNGHNLCNIEPNLQTRNNINNLCINNKCTKNGTVSCNSEEFCRIKQHIWLTLAKLVYKLYIFSTKQIAESPGTPWMFVYVLIYKLGEQGAIGLFPLFLIDSGISPAKVGLWTGVVGQSMSIVGSLAAGWLMAKKKVTSGETLTVLALARILPITAQSLIVWVGIGGTYELALLAMCITQLIGGAITSATFTAMMHCSQQASVGKQTLHWTILATLEVMGKLAFGSAAGVLADFAGYTLVFLMFTLLSAFVPIWLFFGQKYFASFSSRGNQDGSKKKN